MNVLTTKHVNSILILSCILFAGCQGTATDGKETDGTPDGANATSGQSQDTAARVLGKWKMDEEKSRAGWGDREADLERMMVDEIGMGIEFKPDNAITITKSGGSGDGFWEVIEKFEDSITLEMSAKRDSKKKVQVKITFTGNDQILYQTSEMEFKEDMIFTRDDG